MKLQVFKNWDLIYKFAFRRRLLSSDFRFMFKNCVSSWRIRRLTTSLTLVESPPLNLCVCAPPLFLVPQLDSETPGLFNHRWCIYGAQLKINPRLFSWWWSCKEKREFRGTYCPKWLVLNSCNTISGSPSTSNIRLTQFVPYAPAESTCEQTKFSAQIWLWLKRKQTWMNVGGNVAFLCDLMRIESGRQSKITIEGVRSIRDGLTHALVRHTKLVSNTDAI